MDKFSIDRTFCLGILIGNTATHIHTHHACILIIFILNCCFQVCKHNVNANVTGPVKTRHVGTKYILLLVISFYWNRIFLFCNFYYKSRHIVSKLLNFHSHTTIYAIESYDWRNIEKVVKFCVPTCLIVAGLATNVLKLSDYKSSYCSIRIVSNKTL